MIWKLVRDESEMGIAARFNCGLIKLNNTESRFLLSVARRERSRGISDQKMLPKVKNYYSSRRDLYTLSLSGLLGNRRRVTFFNTQRVCMLIKERPAILYFGRWVLWLAAPLCRRADISKSHALMFIRNSSSSVPITAGSLAALLLPPPRARFSFSH